MSNFNEIFRKDVTYDNIKILKKRGLHPLSRRYIFGKTTGEASRLRVKDISKYDENFIKSYNEESDKGYFLEVDVQYPEVFHNLHNGLPFFS